MPVQHHWDILQLRDVTNNSLKMTMEIYIVVTLETVLWAMIGGKVEVVKTGNLQLEAVRTINASFNHQIMDGFVHASPTRTISLYKKELESTNAMSIKIVTSRHSQNLSTNN